MRHKVVTSGTPFLPRDGRNHIRYSMHLPAEGWPGWVGLSDLNKYLDGRPARSSPILTGLIESVVDVTNAVSATPSQPAEGIVSNRTVKR